MTQMAITSIQCAACKCETPIDQANEHVFVTGESTVTDKSTYLCLDCNGHDLDTYLIAQNTTYDDDLLRSVDIGSHELKELKGGSVVFWNEQERVCLDREEAYYALVTLQAMFRDQESFQGTIEPTRDDDDDDEESDCSGSHRCTSTGGVVGYCILKAGHAGNCYCGTCASSF